MWFKVFVLLRLPVSVIALLGYGFALGALGGMDMAFLGGMLSVGLYIFPALVTKKLFQRRRDALRLAWWLLALETVGGVLLLVAADYTNTREFELAVSLVFASIILVAWTMPNALFFYMARGKFAESAESKPQSQEK
jgi:hypothetical protein